LLGGLHRHLQNPRGVDQEGDVANQTSGTWNEWDQFFLHVDDEQAGIAR